MRGANVCSLGALLLVRRGGEEEKTWLP
jgi:hypothetical protein